MNNKDIYNATKNVDTFKLLASDKDFLKLIKDFRIAENIDYTKDPIEWLEKQSKKANDWRNSDKYILTEKKIIADYKNKKINIIERKRLFKELVNKSPNNIVKKFVEDIIIKFDLPYNFYSHINNFIFTNNFNNNPLLGASHFFEETHQDRDEKIKILSINIYQKPSEEDFELLKRFIKRRTENFPKYKEIKDLEMKLELESAYDNKDEYKKIEENIDNKLIAQDILKDSTKNKTVVDKVSFIKKKRRDLFHKKSSGKSHGK